MADERQRDRILQLRARDGRNHGPGLSQSKHFQLNDLTAARDQILASNEYRTRDEEGPKATSKTEPEARGWARKKRKIGRTDTNLKKQPCLSPVDEDEQVSEGKRDGGVEEDGNSRQEDSVPDEHNV
ncbi:hypothetical protein CBER1_11767 [Cercospora berteroae]|uniref:Uncharacterized protein n=1 Tax=Cercospora berteroae TaxID=357750 RepID=A0A2S6CIL0_9PEZI|nr:hypothetical protein CBER1_11767 [Cercospora berteroae]